jgi:alkylation response protein AidB-like acyl-CoA dehydrogenase
MLGDDGLDLDLWAELAGLGLLGLTIPEEHSGAGATFTEVAVVAEELGRTLAPVPYLSSAVLGTVALLHGAGDAQRAAHLPPSRRGRPAWRSPTSTTVDS